MWLRVLGAMLLALFVVAHDSTAVSVVLNSIADDLKADSSFIWIVSAYLLTFTTFTPIAGSLSDRLGRKIFMLLGLTVFLVGSILCGISQTMVELIVYRAVQGIGAGIIQVISYALLADIFPPAQVPRWQGLFGGVFGLSMLLGPTIGGWFTEHWNWRWIFFINVPIPILSILIIIVFLKLPHKEKQATARMDWFGLFLITGMSVCLLLGFHFVEQTMAWNADKVVYMFGAAALLFVLFLIAEWKAIQPIIPLSLFKNRIVTMDSLISLGVGAVIIALPIYLPMIFIGILGESVTTSGTLVTPITLMIVVGATISGRLLDARGKYQLLTILASIITGGGSLLFMLIDRNVTLLPLLIYGGMMGIGIGMFLPILRVAVQNALPASQVGVGIGTVTYLQSLGSTIGSALLGTIMQDAFSKKASDLQILQPENQTLLLNEANKAGIDTSLLQSAIDATRGALLYAIHHVFLTAGLISILLLICAAFLKDKALREEF